MLSKLPFEISEDTRASAHTVGYILMIAIFLVGGISLFVASITLFSEVGGNPVNDAHNEMQKLQSSFNSFTNGAPSREATLRGPDSTITYGSPITVTVEARSNTGENFANSRPSDCNHDEWCTLGKQDITPLVYQVEEGQVAYVNGALILSQGEGSALVKSKGAWYIGDYARFPLLATEQADNSPGNIGLSGSGGTFNVKGYSQAPNTTVWRPPPSDPGADQNLKVRVTMERLNNIDAWRTYFDTSDSFTVQSTDTDSITLTFTTDRIIVRGIPIDVQYSSGK